MVNIQGMLEKTKLLFTDPKEAWQKISSETHSLNDIYINYLIPAVVFAALCRFIKSSIIGYSIVGQYIRVPFFAGIVSALFMIALSLLMPYLFSFVANFLAQKFSGKDDQLSVFAFFAYTSIISLIASPLCFIPWIGILLQFLIGIYALYVFYLGITPMTGVPEGSRIMFFISMIGVGIVFGIIVSIALIPLKFLFMR
jgi:uncharacterized protein involved in cysteine biosynthesis